MNKIEEHEFFVQEFDGDGVILERVGDLLSIFLMFTRNLAFNMIYHLSKMVIDIRHFAKLAAKIFTKFYNCFYGLHFQRYKNNSTNFPHQINFVKLCSNCIENLEIF